MTIYRPAVVNGLTLVFLVLKKTNIITAVKKYFKNLKKILDMKEMKNFLKRQIITDGFQKFLTIEV